jgi:ribonuclease HI
MNSEIGADLFGTPKSPTMPAEHTAEIYFDGGCEPNPGRKYGSYELKLNGDTAASKHRVEFGGGTNNEAEFDALLLALDALERLCQDRKIDPRNVDIFIQTDSMIVRDWIQNYARVRISKIKNERRLVMWKYAGRCIAALKPYLRHHIGWQPRDRNVERFGH